MFDKPHRKIKRSAKLISVLSKYGFQDLLSRMGVQSSEPSKTNSENLYKRIRMALEELGPTFVKLGQSFSNREDLLPPELIAELQKLQDNVDVLDLNVKEILETELGISTDDFFLSIQEEPIAAASIAQVYKAILKDGTPVILKIKRPNIQKTIEDDLLLLKDLVSLIDTYTDAGKKISLKSAVSAFEKSLLQELSLVNEKNNIQQFAYNFRNNKQTYVPKVYGDFCNNSILCMEFVDGIKVTDKTALIANMIDPVQISEVGLRLFVSQILDFGFFHADPHAGNILVKKDGKIVFIDFGAVGKIQPNDKETLESLILNFMSKNASKIVWNLKKMAVQYTIPNERKFEGDVQEILDDVHSSSLQEINVQELLKKMRDILQDNQLLMPEYFYLLFKGITLIEGVGRSINPDLDIVKTLKPYAKTLFLRKINPEHFLKSGMNRALNFTDNIDEIPKELRSILHKLDDNKLTVSSEIKNLEQTNAVIKTSVTNLIFALVLCANMIATAILWSAGTGPKIGEFPVFALLGILISLSILTILTLRILRK